MANELAPVSSGGLVTKHSPIVDLGMGGAFEFAQQVTRTVLQQERDVAFYVQIEGPFERSKMDPTKSKFKDVKTGEGVVPEVCDVVNVATGELQILIGNTVLASELRRMYPDDGYVGRFFAIMPTKPEGIDGRMKNYVTYKIVEIKPKGGGGAFAAAHNRDVSDADQVDNARRNRVKG